MREDWSAILLAGVYDWGVCTLNKARLRPLVPIVNRPIIEHVLRAVQGVGIERAAICANGHGDAVRAALDARISEQMRLHYHDDTMPRGPAGCVKDAASAFGDGHLMVVEASVLPCFDIAALIDGHMRSGSALTVATQCRTAGGESTYTPVGMYALSYRALEHIADKGFRDIKEGLIPSLHEAGLRVDVHPIQGMAARLHGISSYFAINDWAVRLAGKCAWDLDGHVVRESAVIHLDARVDASAQVLGPVIIGSGAVVRSGAILVGPTTVGRNATIGEGSVVSRSAIWDGGVVGSGAQVDRCVVGDRARVPSDARFFKEVRVAGDRPHRTGLWRLRDAGEIATREREFDTADRLMIGPTRRAKP